MWSQVSVTVSELQCVLTSKANVKEQEIKLKWLDKLVLNFSWLRLHLKVQLLLSTNSFVNVNSIQNVHDICGTVTNSERNTRSNTRVKIHASTHPLDSGDVTAVNRGVHLLSWQLPEKNSQFVSKPPIGWQWEFSATTANGTPPVSISRKDWRMQTWERAQDSPLQKPN